MLNCNYLINDIMRFYFSPVGFYVGDNFLEIRGANIESLVISLNSIVTQLLANLYGRTNFGGGLLKIQTYEVARVECTSPTHIPGASHSIFQSFSKLAATSLFEQLGLPKPNRDFSNIVSEGVSLETIVPDRRNLDQIVFEALGLTDEEQLAAYRAVVQLVKDRLARARSV